MPKRLVFIEVDQEGKPVVSDGVLYDYDSPHNFAVKALASLPSASEALVEAIAKEIHLQVSDPDPWPKADQELYRTEARTLLSRVEGQT